MSDHKTRSPNGNFKEELVCQKNTRLSRAEKKFAIPILAIIWIVFFCLTTSVALLFQYLVLPMVPSLHAGQGLLSHDSLYFHKVALKLAATIARDGWSAWTPWPTHSAGGNAAVLAALYALFGPNPSAAIPINALLHASSGVLLILIGRELSAKPAARVGSVIAACLFIGFPSALNWYGQIHKDGYAILGFLLLLYSGVKILKLDHRRDAIYPLITAFAGLTLTAFVRTDNLQLFQIMSVGMFVLMVAMVRRLHIRLLVQIMFVVMIALAAIVIRPAHQLESSIELVLPERGADAEKWQWISTPGVPAFADNLAKKVSQWRVYMAEFGVSQNAGSMIDVDTMPGNVVELIGYLPRALMVGLFAPFPDTWLSKVSLPRLVGVAETLIWYLIFPGLLWTAWRRRQDPVLWWLLGCALAILTVESFITPNLGTLHRVRYPFLFVLILLGTIGWAEAISKYWRKTDEFPTSPVLADQPDVSKPTCQGASGRMNTSDL